MRRAIATCVVAGTFVFGNGFTNADEPSTGLSRWLRNPFAKGTKAEMPSTEGTPAATGESETVERQGRGAAPAAPVSPRDDQSAVQPAAALRRNNASPQRGSEGATVISGRAAGLGRRMPSARAAKATFADDDEGTTPATISPRRSAITPARPVEPSYDAAGESLVEGSGVDSTAAPLTAAPTTPATPPNPPRRRFIPLMRGASPPMSTAPTPVEETSEAPAVPPEEAETPISTVESIPDPAVPRDVSADEEPAISPRGRGVVSGRRPAVKRPAEVEPMLDIDAGELEEVRAAERDPNDEATEEGALDDSTDGEARPQESPREQGPTRTVKVDNSPEQTTPPNGERPSLSQRFKSWWNVRK